MKGLFQLIFMTLLGGCCCGSVGGTEDPPVTLRGAMLDPSYLTDDDYRVFFEEWKGNLARCQLNRDWGKMGRENYHLDLAEYDQWITNICTRIDPMLKAARSYGARVIIYLHAPPGGRLTDPDRMLAMRMFYEKKYQDHFVTTWEYLARRYRGHPEILAYDLINEPLESKTVPPEPGMGYWDTQLRASRSIRAIDPQAKIIVTS